MTEDTHTAIHEAGHAVAFVRLWPNARISDNVTIEREQNTLGYHRAEEICFPAIDDPDEITRLDSEFEKEAIYCCAGYAALVAAGYSEEEALLGANSDFAKAKEVADLSMEEISKKSVELMTQPDNIAAVAKVADELLRRKTIYGDQVETLVELSDGEITDDDYRVIARMQRWD